MLKNVLIFCFTGLGILSNITGQAYLMKWFFQVIFTKLKKLYYNSLFAMLGCSILFCILTVLLWEWGCIEFPSIAYENMVNGSLFIFSYLVAQFYLIKLFYKKILPKLSTLPNNCSLTFVSDMLFFVIGMGFFGFLIFYFFSFYRITIDSSWYDFLPATFYSRILFLIHIIEKQFLLLSDAQRVESYHHTRINRWKSYPKWIFLLFTSPLIFTTIFYFFIIFYKKFSVLPLIILMSRFTLSIFLLYFLLDLNFIEHILKKVLFGNNYEQFNYPASLKNNQYLFFGLIFLLIWFIIKSIFKYFALAQ